MCERKRQKVCVGERERERERAWCGFVCTYGYLCDRDIVRR